MNIFEFSEVGEMRALTYNTLLLPRESPSVWLRTVLCDHSNAPFESSAQTILPAYEAYTVPSTPSAGQCTFMPAYDHRRVPAEPMQRSRPSLAVTRMSPSGLHAAECPAVLPSAYVHAREPVGSRAHSLSTPAVR